jgi:sugar lactone lactonase YvrE
MPDLILSQPEMILPATAEVGEGPLWDPRVERLYWIDITRGRLFRFDPATGKNESRELGRMIGAAMLTEDPEVLLLALADGLHRLDRRTDQLAPLSDPEPGQAQNRMNDGKVAPDGSVWVSTMEYDGRPGQGRLYRWTAGENAWTPMPGQYNIPNGLGWSPDGSRFYHIESGPEPRRLDVYHVRDDGHVEPLESIAMDHEPNGVPDGMTVDAEGRLWIAYWGGGCVRVIEPDRWQTVARIELPVAQVAACEFAGPELTDLYITTANYRLDPPQPDGGSLFRVRTSTQGQPANHLAPPRPAGHAPDA